MAVVVVMDVFGQAASQEEEGVEGHRKLASRTVSNGVVFVAVACVLSRNAVRSGVRDPINSRERDTETGGGHMTP